MQGLNSDLVLMNCMIYTVDKNRSWAEALAISGDKIDYVGNSEGIKAFIGPNTTIHDLQDKMILPGFVDAHAHPSQAMDFIGNINLLANRFLEVAEDSWR